MGVIKEVFERFDTIIPEKHNSQVISKLINARKEVFLKGMWDIFGELRQCNDVGVLSSYHCYIVRKKVHGKVD